jgi:hypothetical protein
LIIIKLKALGGAISNLGTRAFNAPCGSHVVDVQGDCLKLAARLTILWNFLRYDWNSWSIAVLLCFLLVTSDILNIIEHHHLK